MTTETRTLADKNTIEETRIPDSQFRMPTSTNKAVERCCEAMRRCVQTGVKSRSHSIYPAMAGSASYCDAMPPLSGYDNIKDFIACTAHGVLIGTIDKKKGTQLLYAAQVALSIQRVFADHSTGDSD
jgi:hypothetical protein